tara:strand:+ start:92 stop:676 length:585 start_codon:yes stop_codon:yes gene_type:complete
MPNKEKKMTKADEIRTLHKKVSSTPTPAYYIEERQKFEYVDEAFMRSVLNDNYPIWHWEIKDWKVVEGSIAVHGRLMIDDCGVVRCYDAIASHRIALQRDGSGHVDLGNDLKAANTDCFKVAVNRLCNVSDDIYRKSVLSESQLDTIEGLIEQIPEVSLQRKIIDAIKSKDINTTNYDSSVDKLQQTIKGAKKK